MKGPRLEPALVFMRSRTIGRVAIPIVLVVSFQIAIADQLVKLPSGGERAAARISPIMGALWATIIGSLVLRRSPELEWFSSPRLRGLRLSWGTILVGGTAVGIEAISQIRTLDAFGLQVRNGLLFAGFALLTAVAVGARFVWVPQVLAGGALFGFGTDPTTGLPSAGRLPISRPRLRGHGSSRSSSLWQVSGCTHSVMPVLPGDFPGDFDTLQLRKDLRLQVHPAQARCR